MPESPTTRPSLLVRIRDARDGAAWAQFVDLYAPLIYGLARSKGLQDADAADVTQEVFRSISAAGFVYEPARGSFRGWLYTVTCNKVRDHAARRQVVGSGDTGTQRLLEDQPAPADEAAHWEREYEQRLFAVAAERVQPRCEESTWCAFWLASVEGKSADEIAKLL